MAGFGISDVETLGFATQNSVNWQDGSYRSGVHGLKVDGTGTGSRPMAGVVSKC